MDNSNSDMYVVFSLVHTSVGLLHLPMFTALGPQVVLDIPEEAVGHGVGPVGDEITTVRDASLSGRIEPSGCVSTYMVLVTHTNGP